MKSLILLFLFSFATSLVTINWTVDEDYAIRFDTSAASGTFKGLKGDITFDPTDLKNAQIDVNADVNTISTGNTTKDNHARNSSWFDAEQYPTIRFVSTSFTKATAGYVVTGQLTLHGTTKKISFPFTFEETATGGLFVGDFQVNRKDYGINGNAFSFAVGKEVDIELRIPVSSQ